MTKQHTTTSRLRIVSGSLRIAHSYDISDGFEICQDLSLFDYGNITNKCVTPAVL